MPVLKHSDIVPLVLSFEIDEEKTSRVRYIASFSFQFRRGEVRRFLEGAGVSFAETRSKPVLLLPVWDLAGAKLLWDDPNPWFSAWNEVPPLSGLVPLRLPVGDLADIRDISAEQASAGIETQIAIIRERYGAATAVVAEARLDTFTVPGRGNVNVSLRYLGGPWADQTDIRNFPIIEGETDVQALSRIAFETYLQIEEDWKRDNILRLDTSENLVANFALRDLREWIEMRRQLQGVAYIKTTQLVALSRTLATVRLNYFGDPRQLRTALAQRDIILERGGVNWILRDARTSATKTVPVIKTPPESAVPEASPMEPDSSKETVPPPVPAAGTPR